MRGIPFRRPDKKNKRVIIGVIFLIAVLFFLVFFPESISNTFFHLSRPFQSTLWNVGDTMSAWVYSILRQGDLVKERDILLTERERLMAEVVRLREIREENIVLREALVQGIDRDFKVIMANVLSKDILEDIIVIDRGSRDGIKEGMPIITEKRVAVGQVVEVFNNFSRVMLITHKDSTFDAEIQGKDTIGLVNGLGDSRTEITLIPNEKNIQVGDALVTIPLGEIFPRGLFIGLVKNIGKDDTDSFQKAEISPFFSIRRLRRVFVITDASQ